MSSLPYSLFYFRLALCSSPLLLSPPCSYTPVHYFLAIVSFTTTIVKINLRICVSPVLGTLHHYSKIQLFHKMVLVMYSVFPVVLVLDGPYPRKNLIITTPCSRAPVCGVALDPGAHTT